MDSLIPVAGGWFTPDGLCDSGGDSTALVTGKYTANYFSYKYGVEYEYAERLVQQWGNDYAWQRLAPGGSLTPHGLCDSSWDSVTLVTRNTQQVSFFFDSMTLG